MKTLKSLTVSYPALKVSIILIMLVCLALIILKIDYFKSPLKNLEEVTSLRGFHMLPLLILFFLIAGALVPTGLIFIRKIKGMKRYFKTFWYYFIFFSFIIGILVFLFSIVYYFTCGNYHFIPFLITLLIMGEAYSILLATIPSLGLVIPY